MSIDPLKVIVQVQNQQEIQKLTIDAQNAELEIKKLNAAFQQSAKSAQDLANFQAAAMPFANTMAQAANSIKALEPAAGSAGRGLGQLAYAIDDIQYGFNAIVNNIPQIVLGLGGGMGMAGVAGIAAVAINQLYKHWDELIDRISSYWSGTAVEQLEHMRKVAEDAAEALKKVPGFTKGQENAAKGVADFVQEGPKDALIRDIMGAMAANPVGMAADEEVRRRAKEKNEMLKQMGAIGGPFKSSDADIEKQVLADRQKRAELLAGRILAPGEEGKKALAELGVLLPERKGDLRQMTPEGQEAIKQQQLEAQGQHNARVIDQKFREKGIAEEEKMLKDVQRLEKQDKAEEKRDEKMIHDADIKADREQFNENKQRRIDAQVDQEEVLHKRLRQLQEGKQANQGMGAFDSYEGWLKGLGRDTGQQQLEEEKAIKKTLEDIHETLKQERRAKFA